jgi:TPR repeat protein
MKSSVQAIVVASIFAFGFFAVAHGASGAPPQSETAKPYYKLAAQGDPEAQAKLGELYAKGYDVEQSDATAFQWFMRAAAQGHSRAQLTLAEIWTNGRGVPRSDALAYRWATIAKMNSVDSDIRDAADKLIAQIATNLYADQIADARQRASEWKPDVETSQTIQAEPAAAVSAAKAQAKTPARKAPAVKAVSPRTQSKKVRAVSSISAEKRLLRAHLMRLARRYGF